MCGIVGYVGYRKAIPVLLEGLGHLEYRGYDSAGIACLDHQKNSLFIVKEKGKLGFLKKELREVRLDSYLGIGHTRWATHGEPSRANAHPHSDFKNRIAIVHNGIVENYADLKTQLKKSGSRFYSETDTEVAANLIGHYYQKGKLLEAVRNAVGRIHGFFAFAVISRDEPETLVAFKRSNPLVIGLGENENFLASDVSALLPYTRKVLFLEDDELAILRPSGVEIRSLKNFQLLKRKFTKVNWDITQAKRGGYPHFMLKEIHEQPQVIQETLNKRLDSKDNIVFDTLNRKAIAKLKRIEKIHFVSCGTAYHAGIIGGIAIKDLVRLPAEAQVSSEFRYSDPIVSKKDMVILITQSGETADTLAALREAKRKGAYTLAVVNVIGSTIAREADAVIYTQAGPEIGVASTKAYMAQILTLDLFALYLAKIRKLKSRREISDLIAEIKKLPASCRSVLKNAHDIERFSKREFRCKNFLYLGRGYNFATALEGALKLKEISYAHAHGYAAGEMKHGPIALIDNKQPVICIAPAAKTYEKMISNIQEIRARGGIVMAIGSSGDEVLPEMGNYFVEIPKTMEIFSPLLAVVPLQLLAYRIAVLNHRDVDQPRNLAKSVTVE